MQSFGVRLGYNTGKLKFCTAGVEHSVISASYGAPFFHDSSRVGTFVLMKALERNVSNLPRLGITTREN